VPTPAWAWVRALLYEGWNYPWLWDALELKADHASGNLAVEVQFHRIDSESGVGPFVLVYEMEARRLPWQLGAHGVGSVVVMLWELPASRLFSGRRLDGFRHRSGCKGL